MFVVALIIGSIKTFDADWGKQAEIRDGVLKAIAATDSISYVHSMHRQKNANGETATPAEASHTRLTSQEPSKQEHSTKTKQVLSPNCERGLDERPEDALEVEVLNDSVVRML